MTCTVGLKDALVSSMHTCEMHGHLFCPLWSTQMLQLHHSKADFRLVWKPLSIPQIQMMTVNMSLLESTQIYQDYIFHQHKKSITHLTPISTPTTPAFQIAIKSSLLSKCQLCMIAGQSFSYHIHPRTPPYNYLARRAYSAYRSNTVPVHQPQISLTKITTILSFQIP